jgi:hypothetical protein
MAISSNMAFSIDRAVDFCKVFRNPSLSADGKFKEQHFKALNQDERKICLAGLDKVANAQLSDWDGTASDNQIKSERLKEITDKITSITEKIESKDVEWYKAPFIWIAKTVHSFFLWFQNAFLGRISTKQLIDKVAVYYQDASSAQGDVDGVEKTVLPAIESAIQSKLDDKTEIILKTNLSNGLLEIYKLLFKIKSAGKSESIMERAVVYSHVDGLKDQPTKSYHQVVYSILAPYFGVGDANKKISVDDLMVLQEASKKGADLKDPAIFSNASKVLTSLIDVEPQHVPSMSLVGYFQPALQALNLIQKFKEIMDEIEDLQDELEKKPENAAKITDLKSISDNMKMGIVEQINMVFDYFNIKFEVLDKLFNALQLTKEDLNVKNLQKLQEEYKSAKEHLAPLLVFDKAKKVTKVLAPLFQEAKNAIACAIELEKAIEIFESAKKVAGMTQPVSKKIGTFSEEIVLDGQSDSSYELEKLGKQIEDFKKAFILQEVKVADQFTLAFKQISNGIEQEGIKLKENTYGVDPVLYENKAKLEMVRLKDYGLISLLHHQNRCIEKVELLKRKYL